MEKNVKFPRDQKWVKTTTKENLQIFVTPEFQFKTKNKGDC